MGFLIKKMHQLIKGEKSCCVDMLRKCKKNKEVTVRDLKEKDVTQEGCRRVAVLGMN